MLHKKIAKLYMQRQAGMAVFIFPSITASLKSFSFKDEVSDIIIETLTNMLIDVVYVDSSTIFDFDIKVLSKKNIMDEIVTGEMPESGDAYGWSPAEDITEEGIVGQSVKANIVFNAIDVASVLAQALNTQAQGMLINKITAKQLLEDFQSKEFINVLNLMVKVNFNKVKFSEDEIENFIHAYDEFDVDYLAVNGLENGYTRMESAMLKAQDVTWNNGNMIVNIFFEETHYVKGSF